MGSSSFYEAKTPRLPIGPQSNTVLPPAVYISGLRDQKIRQSGMLRNVGRLPGEIELRSSLSQILRMMTAADSPAQQEAGANAWQQSWAAGR